ncbi:MAG: ribonuclease HI family protein [Patescibacteria group bacterium]
MRNFEIYCDGGARGNPGPAASAFVVYEDGKIIHKEGKFLGVATNNVAEYSAVIMALIWLKEIASVTFFLDSELVVKQLTGVFKIKNENLKDLAIKAKTLKKNFSGKIIYKNLRREKNTAADSLVNETLDMST